MSQEKSCDGSRVLMAAMVGCDRSTARLEAPWRSDEVVEATERRKVPLEQKSLSHWKAFLAQSSVAGGYEDPERHALPIRPRADRRQPMQGRHDLEPGLEAPSSRHNRQPFGETS